ncbi:hypothetical protein PoB_007371700 [Plakobranchus ocellatus]|uniref:Uncharacterized protein n=1 Tax=Plakobranchus ocellatus TaxID=259542 RepID=A0AAV4DT72_9GAST|nr:hypothetical protein PoB_007371700 [Plakobranchus ocellatus]
MQAGLIPDYNSIGLIPLSGKTDRKYTRINFPNPLYTLNLGSGSQNITTTTTTTTTTNNNNSNSNNKILPQNANEYEFAAYAKPAEGEINAVIMCQLIND